MELPLDRSKLRKKPKMSYGRHPLASERCKSTGLSRAKPNVTSARAAVQKRTILLQMNCREPLIATQRAHHAHCSASQIFEEIPQCALQPWLCC